MSLPLVAHWNIRPRFCIAEDTTHFYHRTKESTDCESSSMVLSSSSSKRWSQCCGREKWFLVLTSQKKSVNCNNGIHRCNRGMYSIGIANFFLLKVQIHNSIGIIDLFKIVCLQYSQNTGLSLPKYFWKIEYWIPSKSVSLYQFIVHLRQ